MDAPSSSSALSSGDTHGLPRDLRIRRIVHSRACRLARRRRTAWPQARCQEPSLTSRRCRRDVSNSHVSAGRRRGAGGEMRIRLQARRPVGILLAAQEQRELRVRLQSEHAVDDLCPGLLEPLGPVDVGFLVEPGEELDDNCHLLALVRCIDQGFHQHRGGAGAVDRLLDRDDAGIVGGAGSSITGRTAGTDGAAGRRDGESSRNVAESAAGQEGSAGTASASLFHCVDERAHPREIHGPVTAYRSASTSSSCQQGCAVRRQVAATSSRTIARLALQELPSRACQILDFFLVEPQSASR